MLILTYIVKQILNGDYSAAPSHVNCSYCAYVEICEDNYRETGHKELSLVEMETQLQQEDTGTSKEIASMSQQETITQLASYFPQAVEQYYRLIIIPYLISCTSLDSCNNQNM